MAHFRAYTFNDRREDGSNSLGPQSRDEMKSALAYEWDRPRVKIETALPEVDPQLKVCEGIVPFLLWPIVVGKSNSMVRISDPIHQPKGLKRQRPLHRMILENNTAARNSPRFSQQDFGIIGVVEHIDQADRIEGLVLEWQNMAVELRNRDLGARSNQNVHTLNAQPRIWFLDEPVNGPLAASHIEKSLKIA
jgi:hypothetical protein